MGDDELRLGDDLTVSGGDEVCFEVEAGYPRDAVDRLSASLDFDEVRRLVGWLTAWLEENKS